MTEQELQHIISQGESETVEFKQSFSKAVLETIVAFSNHKGGKVLIGVNNISKTVGVTLTHETVQKWLNEVKQNTLPQVMPNADIIKTQSKTVVVLSVIEYPVKPVSFKNKFYKRVLNSNHLMSLTEIANEHLRTINSSWDYYTDPNHNLEHISLKKVEKYIDTYEKWNETKVEYTPLEFLNKQEILKNNKLTYGAYLLFADELCIISDIQIGRFKSESKIIDSLSLETDILTEVDQIIAFIKKHLMVEFIITGNPQREERYDYPLDAIREIVINMVVHRDYRNSSGSIIKIYDNRIEFYNPGSLYGNLTLKELLEFKHKSQTRNKLIAKVFKAIGEIEKYGSGIKRIFDICSNYGIRPPEFKNIHDGFEVVLFKEKISGGLSGGLNGGLSGGLNNLYNTIKINPNKNTKELSVIVNIPYKTVEKWLAKLKTDNKIEFIGSKKTGGYFIVP